MLNTVGVLENDDIISWAAVVLVHRLSVRQSF